MWADPGNALNWKPITEYGRSAREGLIQGQLISLFSSPGRFPFHPFAFATASLVQMRSDAPQIVEKNFHVVPRGAVVHHATTQGEAIADPRIG
jgi:hypothetical protein